MSRFGSANTRIVSSGRTHRTGGAVAPKRSIVFAILCAATAAGCARHSDQQVAGMDPAQSELQACQSMRPLLEPQPAPDCEFRESNLKTVDPDAFARLKLDYERQCYRRAEKLARDRLRLLQHSNRCEIRPVRRSLADN